MDIVIKSCIKSLEKSVSLLSLITIEEYVNQTVSPYYSSVGSHLRHIFDMYDCILTGSGESYIDLTLRSRDLKTETNKDIALTRVNSIISELSQIDSLGKPIIVADDLGLGKVELKYTLEGILAQANSHTIHHYAIINYILDRLHINFEDEDFGVNPTTPKHKAY